MTKQWAITLTMILAISSVVTGEEGIYRPYFPRSRPEYNRPDIQKSEPPSFIQAPPGLSDYENRITLYGTGLWPQPDPRFFANTKRVRILLRREANYVEVYDYSTGTEGDLQTLTFRFSSRQFLSQPGTMNVVVEVDGKASWMYPIPVLAAPTTSPSIGSIHPNKFNILSSIGPNESPQKHFRFTLRGSDFDSQDQMSLIIGGINTPIEKLSIQEGSLEAVVPQAYWSRPGDYGVKLFTRAGNSSVYIITIEPPPKPPGETAPKAPTPKPAKKEVKGSSTDQNSGF